MKVVVTRPRGRERELVDRLEALGHEVSHCPLIAVEPLGQDTLELSGYDWLVVTSATAAAELARRGRGRPRRIAAIGPGTARALGEAGLEPDLVPAVSTQEGLLAELPRPAGRVLFAGAAGARGLIAEELGADFVALYRTVQALPERPPAGDVVVLASASAARAFAALESALPAVSIGPQTTAAAVAAGVRVVAEAKTHDLEGLVSAIRRLEAARP